MSKKIIKKSSQSFSHNELALLLTMALVITVGYMVFSGEAFIAKERFYSTDALASFPADSDSADTSKPASENAKWEGLFPDMRTILQDAFPNMHVLTARTPSLYQKGDITGDGMEEALVAFGPGSTTGDDITLMVMEKGRPTVSLFKQKDGSVSTLVFSTSADGAGRYGSAVEMMSDNHVVYSAGYSKYGDIDDSCGSEAYQWNAGTNLFEYSQSLSEETAQNYCRTVGF